MEGCFVDGRFVEACFVLVPIMYICMWGEGVNAKGGGVRANNEVLSKPLTVVDIHN